VRKERKKNNQKGITIVYTHWVEEKRENLISLLLERKKKKLDIIERTLYKESKKRKKNLITDSLS
jgi:hypothetical protein